MDKLNGSWTLTDANIDFISDSLNDYLESIQSEHKELFFHQKTCSLFAKEQVNIEPCV
jgi:hypothetical protein